MWALYGFRNKLYKSPNNYLTKMHIHVLWSFHKCNTLGFTGLVKASVGSLCSCIAPSHSIGHRPKRWPPSYKLILSSPLIIYIILPWIQFACTSHRAPLCSSQNAIQVHLVSANPCAEELDVVRQHARTFREKVSDHDQGPSRWFNVVPSSDETWLAGKSMATPPEKYG